LLDLKNLAFSAADKIILDDFSMTIQASEVHALPGTNGTGKGPLQACCSAPAAPSSPHHASNSCRGQAASLHVVCFFPQSGVL